MSFSGVMVYGGCPLKKKKGTQGTGEGVEDLHESEPGHDCRPAEAVQDTWGSLTLFYLWAGFTSSREAVKDRESGSSWGSRRPGWVTALVDVSTAHMGTSHALSQGDRRVYPPASGQTRSEF